MPATPDELLRTGRFLVDTNVISHLIRPKRAPAPGIIRFFEQVDEERMFLSVFTVGEIQKGIDAIAWPPESSSSRNERYQLQANLEQRLDALCDRFHGRIIEFDIAAARQYGHLDAAVRRAGLTAPIIDALIATCALVKHLAVATCDADFDRFAGKLTVYNPVTHRFSGLQVMTRKPVSTLEESDTVTFE